MPKTPRQGTPPAWTSADLTDPHARDDKARRVQRMFASIARSYDLNNRLHSFGRDQAWRRAAVRAARPQPNDHVLDVACGTGDLTHAFARAGVARVVGADFTPEMLQLAEVKRAKLPPKTGGLVSYVTGDAQALDFPDASFDILSIAFGIRNVADVDRALREFRRVLRPGGRVVILEFDRPRFAPIRWANSFYSGWVMPRTAALIARDREGAYRYLPRSVQTFMSRKEMIHRLESAGFAHICVRSLTFGVVACYRGMVPG
ncbi:MAG: bifunctional demethylmenaquinone methyltransferase/2-methoxy-6-polyprenyl-1,4-benzoquinol methylase UbiE [Phycisphaeraceae bacterium]|nr:bifunctional demethylmenaquinone methyltransferase/2-methoxy-6-polyprenyl-1,4-benzoquinol methylase UbiE [Phycisphaeraceae bacterium]